MKHSKFSFALIILFLSFVTAQAQNQDERIFIGKENAEKILRESLTNNSQHNVVGEKPLIKDENTAIEIAESVLFEIYSRENIIRQKPYEIYLVDSYWIIMGTLPKVWIGGTFLIIIDSRNSEIKRISHGK